eukprot:7422702-Pyramimonas_sp.AAC.1
MNKDGSLNAKAGEYAGMDRFEVRDAEHTHTHEHTNAHAHTHVHTNAPSPLKLSAEFARRALDTDTAELTVEILSSHLIALERIRFDSALDSSWNRSHVTIRKSDQVRRDGRPRKKGSTRVNHGAQEAVGRHGGGGSGAPQGE